MIEANPDIFTFDPESANDDGPRHQRIKNEKRGRYPIALGVLAFCALGSYLMADGTDVQSQNGPEAMVTTDDCKFEGIKEISFSEEDGAGAISLMIETDDMDPYGNCRDEWFTAVNEIPDNNGNYDVKETRGIEAGTTYFIPAALTTPENQ